MHGFAPVVFFGHHVHGDDVGQGVVVEVGQVVAHGRVTLVLHLPSQSGP
jgi:hypothetical protein